MNRYADYGQLDDQPDIVGDATFNRLDMLTDPAVLPPGSLALNSNMRFDANGNTVRKGLSRQFAAGTSIGTIRFAGIYKPLGEDDQFAFVCQNKLVLFRPDEQTVTMINFPDGETLDAGAPAQTIQAGLDGGTLPQLFIQRGLAKSVLQFDGNATITVAAGFPPSEFALYYQNRIAAKFSAQGISVCDFSDFTTWVSLNQFTILKGGDDFLTLMQAYQNDYVLIGTYKSWQVAFFDPNVGTGGYSGGLTDSSFVRQLTIEAGPVGPEAACEALGKIWFIASDNSIYAFTPQLDGTLIVLGKPVSADIQPIMDRMSSANAAGAAVKRWGYRLYFALPISDVPVGIDSVTITNSTTLGIRLPFTLPARLAYGSIVTVVTKAPHNLSVGSTVLIAGVVSSALNGQFQVVSTPDDMTFSFAADANTDSLIGTQGTVQKLATRNNTIAVYNLNNDGWESIDSLPGGFYADWLRIADYGSQRRLWIIDQNAGPALYEQGESDQIGDVVGGVRLPFTLPVKLSAADYGATPIAGAFTTRAYRWVAIYTNPASAAFNRKVKQCEVRATLDDVSNVTLNLLARTPNNRVWKGSRNFSAGQFQTSDVPLRKICGQRALEAQVQIQVTGGRPTFRSVEIETNAVGRVEE